MHKLTKRKVCRSRHRASSSWMNSNGFMAMIHGERVRTLHHFERVDVDGPLPFRVELQNTYLRTFKVR